MPWPDFGDLILRIERALGRIEGQLQSNTDRLDRIESRVDRLASRRERRKVRWPDVMPYGLGLLILALTWAGKTELAATLASAFGR